LDDPRPTASGERAPADAAARPAAQVRDEAVARRDDILVARALDGDLAAFNQLVEAYQDLCHSLVARMVPDPDQAADAVQEAFFSAYRNLRSYRGPSFRGWLTRIAVNAAMDLQRARKRRPVSPYPAKWSVIRQPRRASLRSKNGPSTGTGRGLRTHRIRDSLATRASAVATAGSMCVCLWVSK